MQVVSHLAEEAVPGADLVVIIAPGKYVCLAAV